MSSIADSILGLHGWVALLIIFGLPALESSAFVGFLFPGELAVLLGGVLAYQGKVSLPAAMVAAILGAVVGDTVGYEVGKRWGHGILHGTAGRIVKEDHLDRAEEYLRERGGKAVFLGRFTAWLRVLMPGMAGMSGMPYRTFAVFNVSGGVIWASGFVLLGYAAGTSYHQVEHYAKEASVLLLGVGLLVVATVWVARRIARNQDAIREFLARQAERPMVARLRRRHRDQLDFLARRFDPNIALGLGLTVSLIGLVLAGWAFGALITDVVIGRHLAGPDHAALRFMVRHRTDQLTAIMRTLTWLGSSAVLLPLSVGVAAVWRWRRRSWLAAGVLGVAGVGSWSSYLLVEHLTGRPRPPMQLWLVAAHGYAFPSGHATEAAAAFGAMAYLLAVAASTWRAQVVAWTAAVLLTGLVGLTRLYLGVHWLSDVAGGWSLGGVWLFATLVLLRQRRQADEPESSSKEGPRQTTGPLASS